MNFEVEIANFEANLIPIQEFGIGVANLTNNS